MTVRERTQNILAFRPVDRLPVIEWATWWDQTLARWHGEGLPESADPSEFFGLDPLYQFWLQNRAPGCPEPASYGHGIIESEADYDRIRHYLYNPEAVRAVAGELRRLKPLHDAGDCAVWMTLEGFFWFPRTLFGIENHLYSFYDEPELYHRICGDLADYYCRVIDEFCDILTPDFMTIAEDMSYNHGPMLSKALYDEFILPYYRRIIPKLKQHGIRVFVDSDGDVTSMIPWLMEGGVEGILPLERQAGVDVNEIRRRFPNFLMIGGFDKMVMKNGEEAMRREFERISPAMRAGGYIPGVDHQTPPDVSIENYRIYVRLLREYALSK